MRTRITVVFMIAIATLLSGCCPAATQMSAAEPGQEAHSPRAVLAAFEAGVDAAVEGLGWEASEELERARGLIALGHAALDACETGGGWLQWVRFALDAIRTLIGFFGQREVGSPSAPSELLDAQRLLESVAP